MRIAHVILVLFMFLLLWTTSALFLDMTLNIISSVIGLMADILKYTFHPSHYSFKNWNLCVTQYMHNFFLSDSHYSKIKKIEVTKLSLLKNFFCTFPPNDTVESSIWFLGFYIMSINGWMHNKLSILFDVCYTGKGKPLSKRVHK